jgi:hypothetical protein
LIGIALSFIIKSESYGQSYSFLWLDGATAAPRQIIKDIPAPGGYQRVATAANSFADWLRHLPLKIENDVVYLFDGSPKGNQSAQYKVLAIDVGNRDLQQCADAVIRLRAEYLFGQRQFDAVAFDFTSGHRAAYATWREGYRPRVRGSKVTWRQTGRADSSYTGFREYLDTVFNYAGSYSLSRELKEVAHPNDITIGDVFIRGGFPGHAVIVLDLAVESSSGKKAFLLAQSYMPAQEIHILRNPNNDEMNPWYEVNGAEKLFTPEWTFEWSELKRFREKN